jgi:Domain of unknown function (DUF4873)
VTTPPDADGYRGPATLRVGAATFDVEADLRGKFEPIDGRYHWYGRLGRNDLLAAALTAGRAEGTIRTAQGTARCEISDPDPWLRYRVSGISRPPFALGPDIVD